MSRVQSLLPRALEAASAVRTSLKLAALAGVSPAAARTLATCLAVCVASPLLRRGGRTLPVVVGGTRFHVDHVADLHVLREVFDAGIYATEVAARPAVVFDVGANIGAATAYFKQRWPGCVVHAFEPDPGAFAKLRRNVGALDGVVLHQLAVGGSDGEITLWSSPAAWESTTLGPVKADAEPVRVAQRTLPGAIELAQVERVDLLKLDVEGAEFALLPQAGPDGRVRAIVAELHFDLVPGSRVDDVRAALTDFELELDGDAAGRMELSARRAA